MLFSGTVLMRNNIFAKKGFNCCYLNKYSLVEKEKVPGHAGSISHTPQVALNHTSCDSVPFLLMFRIFSRCVLKFYIRNLILFAAQKIT